MTTATDSAVLFYAFRYALGRGTYATDEVREALRVHKAKLSPLNRDLIIREIAVAIKHGKTGSAFDTSEWAKTKKHLEETE